MKRRINYTGRKRITRDRISISISNKNGAASFNAILDLSSLDLPNNGKVYVEAYHPRGYARYSFGTVTSIDSPENTDFILPPSGMRILFRVLVIDESEQNGLILATADRIKPDNFLSRSILPVDWRDLGRQVWKLDYEGGEPMLLLNNKIPNIRNIVKNDARFREYVFPAIIRDIFTHILFIDEDPDITDPAEGWRKDWISFAKRFVNIEELIRNINEDQNSQEKLYFIDNLCEQFCFSRGADWKKLINLDEEN